MKMDRKGEPAVIMWLLVYMTRAVSIISSQPESIALVGTKYSIPRQLEFVTIANGKAYFSEDISKNWVEAADHCRSYNMTLATIETHSEWNKLSKELTPFLGGEVWTDARESRKPQMYVWNNTEGQLNPSVVRGWDDRYIRNHDYHYCIVFYSYPSSEYPTGMYPAPCRNKQKILCQLKISDDFNN